MLADKTIIITGSGSGIGRAAARLFAEAGAQLMLADQNESGVYENAAMVTDAGGKALARKMVVNKEVEVGALVEATLEAYGCLDGAYKNAGVQMINKSVGNLTIEDWNRVNDTNATGVFRCLKHEIKTMRETGGEAIVYTASANASVAQPIQASMSPRSTSWLKLRAVPRQRQSRPECESTPFFRYGSARR